MISTVKKQYFNNEWLNNYIVTYNDNTVITVPHNEENRHYQEILEWVANGGTIGSWPFNVRRCAKKFVLLGCRPLPQDRLLHPIDVQKAPEFELMALCEQHCARSSGVHELCKNL